MKATHATKAKRLLDIPNVGPAIARELECLGIKHPQELVGKDAFKLYTKLCTQTGVRYDPCVLDTFMAAVDFMNGAPARSWWQYTKERKKLYLNI